MLRLQEAKVKIFELQELNNLYILIRFCKMDYISFDDVQDVYVTLQFSLSLSLDLLQGIRLLHQQGKIPRLCLNRDRIVHHLFGRQALSGEI